MAGRAVATQGMSRRLSLMARLLGRWRREPEPPHAPRPAGARAPRPAGGPAAVAQPAAPVPPLDGLTIRQWLWGPGYILPGNAEHVLGLVKPFGLDPAMSMLDVAAGLGGPARTVAEEFGVYVTAYERDAELARLGMEMSVAHGMGRRAPITAIDPESFELKPGAFDCIFGREATSALADKERFLRVLVLGLKPRGQLLLTDFVRDPAAGEPPALAAWEGLQPHKPALWTLGQYVDCMGSLGLDIRITEDMTQTYRSQIILGWEALLTGVDLRSLPRAHLLAIVDEAERWMRTVIALESGALRMYRFYAIAAGRRLAAR